MRKLFTVLSLIIALFQFITVTAKTYKGAEFRTKESFLYGRFEASFKACGKEGTLSTMFTYFDGTTTDPWANSKWSEIDIEVIGRYKNDVQFNTITSYATNHVRHNPVNFDPALEYHTYAFEWTPDYIAWFIDGVEVYRQTGSFVKTVTHAQKFMFNMWVPTYSNWMGKWNDQILPAFTYYDWASYYKYTPGTGNYGSNNNFTLDWKDEFTEFDSTRWTKATHTFGGNNCDFITQNSVFKDGKMILCLTNATDLGYTDKKAPAIVSIRALDEYKVQVFYSEEITKTTAEDASRYVMANLPAVKKATLLSDNRTVLLDVEKLDLNSLPVMIAMAGVKDNFDNASGTIAKTIIKAPEFKFPLKIDAGSSTEVGGFIADREFTTDTASYGYMEGSKITSTAEIANTEDDAIYQNGISGLAKYIVRVPNGKYKVRLLFSENTITISGLRIFDVFVQGKQVINALDIFKEGGPKTALEKVVDNVVVTDYMIDIHFAALLNTAIINGIIIEQVGTGIEEHSSIPTEFQLEQNYPNPFNPETTISYTIPSNVKGETINVALKVYDVLGKEVATLVDEHKQPGSYVETLHATSLPSGVYFYKLTAGSYSETKKMLVIK